VLLEGVLRERVVTAIAEKRRQKDIKDTAEATGIERRKTAKKKTR
jgi:hypothetical protein